MILSLALFVAGLFSISLSACSQPETFNTSITHTNNIMTERTRDTATLAGGCFWCIEAVFQRLEGVDTVLSGFSGGTADDANYKAVCTGKTGHAEACQIIYDPSVLSFEDLLQVFFSAHDPTTLNRQGNDVGTQYRSAIFYHNKDQELIARNYIKQLDSSNTWPNPIVTELTPYTTFYQAEDYHQNYFNQNGNQPYCAFVVRPKVEKFLHNFEARVKGKYKTETHNK